MIFLIVRSSKYRMFLYLTIHIVHLIIYIKFSQLIFPTLPTIAILQNLLPQCKGVHMSSDTEVKHWRSTECKQCPYSIITVTIN